MPRTDYSWVDPAALVLRRDERGNAYYVDTVSHRRVPYRQGARALGYAWAQPKRTPAPTLPVISTSASIPAQEPIYRRPRQRYWNLVRTYAKKEGYTKLRAATQDPTFQQALKELRTLHKQERQGKTVDKAPGGKLATALEAVGLRERGAKYPVGETPRKR